MPIITISRGSYSMGKLVAEMVAERLGYECVSRDVLLETSDRYNIPELKLQKAIRDAPSLFDRFSNEKQAYIAFVQATLTSRVAKGNVVYHGFAGHMFLKNVSHVLRVRVMADLEMRIGIVMEREGISAEEAADQIARLDEHRRRWMQELYGADPSDPVLYDLILNLSRMTEEDAVELICHMVARKQFQVTEASQQAMEDLARACALKAALIQKHPDVSVMSRHGNVVVYCDAGDRHERRVKATAQALIPEIDGIVHLEVHAGVPPPPNAV